MIVRAPKVIRQEVNAVVQIEAEELFSLDPLYNCYLRSLGEVIMSPRTPQFRLVLYMIFQEL